MAKAKQAVDDSDGEDTQEFEGVDDERSLNVIVDGDKITFEVLKPADADSCVPAPHLSFVTLSIETAEEMADMIVLAAMSRRDAVKKQKKAKAKKGK